MQNNGVSLGTAMVLLRTSRRTLWRRVSEGEVRRVGEDSRGRTLLSGGDIAKLLGAPLEEDEIALFGAADADDVSAQNELGMAFAEAGDDEMAVYWWRRAADLGDADSMQLLGQAYASGQGVQKDEHLAVSWLSKATAVGHAIAQGQMQDLIRR